MGRFFNAVKAGVRGAMSTAGPGRYEAAGLPVTCQHCRAGLFERREAQLNTAGLNFLDLDWMNRSGTALVCVNCGLITWFAKEPNRVYE